MEKRSKAKPSWIEQRRERRRLARRRKGDSPEKRAERHTPERDWVERWLWSGGIERPNRF